MPMARSTPTSVQGKRAEAGQGDEAARSARTRRGARRADPTAAGPIGRCRRPATAHTIRRGLGRRNSADSGRDEPIELVGTHLRLTGMVVARAVQPADRPDQRLEPATCGSAMRGCCAATASRRTWSCRRSMVDQDEISYIAQTHPAPRARRRCGFVEPASASQAEIRKAREFVHVHAGPYGDRPGPRLRRDGPRRPSSTRPIRASCRSPRSRRARSPTAGSSATTTSC